MAIGVLRRFNAATDKDDTVPFYPVLGLDQFVTGNWMAIAASIGTVTAYSGIPAVGMSRGSQQDGGY